MLLHLLDDSLQVQVFFEEPDCDFADNICLSFVEDCPEEEKLFIHDETNMFITPKQAEALARQLLTAAEQSRRATEEKCSE